ncbi:unnamed protein product [Ectocarpus sp. 12 AP-2014]
MDATKKQEGGESEEEGRASSPAADKQQQEGEGDTAAAAEGASEPPPAASSSPPLPAASAQEESAERAAGEPPAGTADGEPIETSDGSSAAGGAAEQHNNMDAPAAATAAAAVAGKTTPEATTSTTTAGSRRGSEEQESEEQQQGNPTGCAEHLKKAAARFRALMERRERRLEEAMSDPQTRTDLEAMFPGDDDYHTTLLAGVRGMEEGEFQELLSTARKRRRGVSKRLRYRRQNTCTGCLPAVFFRPSSLFGVFIWRAPSTTWKMSNNNWSPKFCGALERPCFLVAKKPEDKTERVRVVVAACRE